MRVVVDDQLALAARLVAVKLPPGVERPLITVYAFVLRIAFALTVDRPTEGVLRGLVSFYRPNGIDTDELLAVSSPALRVLDPTRGSRRDRTRPSGVPVQHPCCRGRRCCQKRRRRRETDAGER